MPKVTMQEYGDVAAKVLAWPRKTRDILIMSLLTKSRAEEEKKAEKEQAALPDQG